MPYLLNAKYFYLRKSVLLILIIKKIYIMGRMLIGNSLDVSALLNGNEFVNLNDAYMKNITDKNP